MRTRFVLALAALGLLAGCGGGSGGGSGPAPSASKSEARFSVDLKTGKVTITPAGGRAVFQGSAVSFTSSDVLSVSGDAGQRLIRIAAKNNSGQTWGAAPVRLTVSNVVNADSAALRAGIAVTTYAGTGSTGVADGFRTSAQLTAPQAVCPGAGPLQGSLIVPVEGAIRRIDASGTVTTLAGMPGALSFADGTGSAARFIYPYDVACDAAGNMFVADGMNYRIRRITPLGEVTTIAGTASPGTTNGSGSAATFTLPFGIAVSPGGDRIYVSDYYAHQIRLIRYVSGPRQAAASYTVSTVAGTVLGLVDGLTARFASPARMALMTDLAGVETLFVADSGNYAIRRIDSPAGVATVATVAGDGVVGEPDGPGGVARFTLPLDLEGQWLSESSFVLYVSDISRVRSISFAAGGSPTQKGSYLVQTLAGASTTGAADGDGYTSRFGYMGGLAAIGNPGGPTIYVADRGNHKVRKVIIPGGALHSGGAATAMAEAVRLANPDSEMPNRTAWTRTLTEASGVWTTDLQFNIPNGVSGFSFLATVETDSNLLNLPAEGAAYVSTLAGSSGPSFSDGPGKQALFYAPQRVVAVPVAMRGLYRSPSGAPIRAFITDWGNYRVRFIDTAGYVGTWAGAAVGSADGVGLAAQFESIAGADLAPDGSLFVTDANRIRRVWPNQQVTTVAGTGAVGSADGPGGVARFYAPFGVAVTAGWQIYVADTGNNTIRRILLTSPDPRSASSYVVSTVAGVAGTAGFANGLGSAALFSNPITLAAGADGRIYVADWANNAVRTLTPFSLTSVQVATLAAAQPGPCGIAVDSVNNVYICRQNWSIARISPTGTVVTLAGSGGAGLIDGAPGAVSSPVGVTVEDSGTLLFADGNTLRAVSRIVDSAVQ